jgi:hypothetical protein
MKSRRTENERAARSPNFSVHISDKFGRETEQK